MVVFLLTQNYFVSMKSIVNWSDLFGSSRATFFMVINPPWCRERNKR